MPAAQRTVHPFGATLHVSASDAGLLRSLDHALALMPTDAGSRGEFSVRISTHADTVHDPAWPMVTVDDTDDRLEVRCGSARLLVDHAGASATIELPTSTASIDDAVRCLLEGAVSSLLIAAGGLHAVHSGLVVAPAGRALLLRGESGAGKSTLTYACMRNGFSVASDDWVYGVPGGPAGRLHGYPWRMFLMPDTVRFFPELAAVSAVPHPSVDRWKLPVVPPAERQQVSADVEAVVFLSSEVGSSAEPIAPADAIERWWRSALATERANLPDVWVEQLLARPCFVVGRGAHPDATAAVLSQLAVSLA